MLSVDHSSGARRPHIVALCGSRRKGSYTHQALEVVLEAVREADGTAELLDLSELDLPPLNPDHHDVGDAEYLTQRMRNADAIVLGTPMYHGSYSGVLKNAIDYCGFDEFENKTVGLLVVSGGPFPLPALEHLRSVCRLLKAWVLPHQAAIPHARTAFDENGIANDALRERVGELGAQIVRFAVIEPNSSSLKVGQID